MGGASFAEEMSTFLDSSTEDGATSSMVGFDYESCGGECYVGTLFCNNGSISLDLADVAAEHAAAAILKETDQVVVSAGELSVNFGILEMRFQEMTVSWWVSAQAFDEKSPQLAGAIAGAKTIGAQIGGQTVTLPVDDNVKSWALACK
jgi:hypothetical protein